MDLLATNEDDLKEAEISDSEDVQVSKIYSIQVFHYSCLPWLIWQKEQMGGDLYLHR